MIYADTNFFTNTLVDMSHRDVAEALLFECPERLGCTGWKSSTPSNSVFF
jgi:hypothetical protein